MEILESYKDLTYLFNRNSLHKRQEIIKLLQTNPSDADGTGWVYGFYSPNDKQLNNDFWIKLGRTNRNPFVRVEQEWGGKLIFCLRSSYDHRLERLIHLFFDFAREERYKDKYDNVKQSQETQIYQTKLIPLREIMNEPQVKEKKSCWLVRFFCQCFIKKKTDNLHMQSVVIQPSLPAPQQKKIKEIEWFHFKEEINVPSLVSQIWQLVENSFKSELLTNPKKTFNPIVMPKININTATEKELMILPSVGKTLASKIVAYRSLKQFDNIEEIKEVNIKLENKYDKLKHRITV
jgi:hypothetical protein